MRYKIVIVKYENCPASWNVLDNYTHNYGGDLSQSTLDSIDDDFLPSGVHVFECDDLKAFDLREEQRKRDEIDYERSQCPHCGDECISTCDTSGPEVSGLDIKQKRKAEIRRIAEQYWMNPECNAVSIAIKNAIEFVDNFNTEFEKLEKGE